MIAPGHKLDLEVFGTAIHASGNLYVKDSEVQIKAHAPHISMGICAANGSLDDSSIAIKIDTPLIFNAFGVCTDEYFTLVNRDMDVDVHTNGGAYGIAPEEDFGAEESRVNVDVSAYTDYGDIGCYGIMCQNAAFLLTDPAHTVTSHAENGIAIGCNLNDIHVETVYDKNDTKKSATDVAFGYRDPAEISPEPEESEASETEESSEEESSAEESSAEEESGADTQKTGVPTWVWPVAGIAGIAVILCIVRAIMKGKKKQ